MRGQRPRSATTPKDEDSSGTARCCRASASTLHMTATGPGRHSGGLPVPADRPGGRACCRRRHLGRRPPEPPPARRPHAADAAQLEDLRERGEPLAILWASEAAIYGRFGYGIAAPHCRDGRRRSRFSFRDDPGPRGAVRIIDAAEALRGAPQVYERCAATPGFRRPRRRWWELYRLADPEQWRRGARPEVRRARSSSTASRSAYAIYRIKSDWQDGFSQSQVSWSRRSPRLPAATRELWRFVFGIDLVVRVQGRYDPGSPLFLMVGRPAQPALKCLRGPLAPPRRRRSRACRARRTAATTRSSSTCRTSSVPGTPGAGASARRWSGRMTTPSSSSTSPTSRRSISAPSTSTELAAAERVRELKPGALAAGERSLPHCPPPVLSGGLLTALEVRPVDDLDEFTRRRARDRPVLRHGPERGAHAALHRPAAAGSHARGVVERGGRRRCGLVPVRPDRPGRRPADRRRHRRRRAAHAPAAWRAALPDARAARRRTRARGATRGAVGLRGVDLRPLRLRACIVLRRDHAAARVHRVRASVRACRERCG